MSNSTCPKTKCPKIEKSNPGEEWWHFCALISVPRLRWWSSALTPTELEVFSRGQLSSRDFYTFRVQGYWFDCWKFSDECVTESVCVSCSGGETGTVHTPPPLLPSAGGKCGEERGGSSWIRREWGPSCSAGLGLGGLLFPYIGDKAIWPRSNLNIT